MDRGVPGDGYRRACSQLRPSARAVQEVMEMKEKSDNDKEKKNIPWVRKKSFVTAAASVCLLVSLSAGTVAATDGQVVEAIKDGVKEIFLTIDKETLEKSAEGKEISVSTQEGVNIRLIEGYGDDDQYYVTLISHVDSGTLGLKVGEDETDITHELAEQGEVVAEYDKDGRSYQVRVFGTVDDPSMEVTEK